jgi:hypothetical protein
MLTWSLVFLVFFGLCWTYLRRPKIAHYLEWYLRAGVAALMAGLTTLATYGAFS